MNTGDRFDPETYMDAVAAALALPIPVEHRAGVAANLARLAELASDVLAFDVPQDPATHTSSESGGALVGNSRR